MPLEVFALRLAFAERFGSIETPPIWRTTERPARDVASDDQVAVFVPKFFNASALEKPQRPGAARQQPAFLAE